MVKGLGFRVVASSGIVIGNLRVWTLGFGSLSHGTSPAILRPPGEEQAPPIEDLGSHQVSGIDRRTN